MNSFVLVFLMTIFNLQAALAVKGTAIPGCLEQDEYLVEGKSKTLCWHAKLEGWVSPDCIKKGASDCGAVKIANLASKRLIPKKDLDVTGGKNPGSLLCVELGGKVMYSRLPDGSQLTFCEARDGTLVDSNVIDNQYGDGK
jgi:putative hemolysin